MASIIARLKERKLVQWALAYLAGAWLIFQAIEVLAGPWGIPGALQRSIHILVVLGFFLTLVLAWYHGEKGRQRASGPELLMIAALFAIAAGVLAVSGRGSEAGTEATAAYPFAVERDRPGVAVLPFANLSPGDEGDYFADGLHEDILNQLAKITSLDVLARQAVLAYRDSDKRPREIGRELSANVMLEGSVRRDGDRVLVTAQLIDCQTEGHLWSEQYDEDLSTASIFSIQGRIARRVAQSIGVFVSPAERARIEHLGTEDLTAYDLLQRYRATASGTPREDRIRLLKRALELDQQYAPAWAYLAIAYAAGFFHDGWDLSWLDSAMVAAELARQLAPDQPEGQLALGFTHVCARRIALAEQYYRRTVELAPSNYLGVNGLGVSYEWLGRLPEAVRWYRRGIALHPSQPTLRNNLADLYIKRLGLREQAESQRAAAALLRAGTRRTSEWPLLLDGEFAEVRELLRSRLDSEPNLRYLGITVEQGLTIGDVELALEAAERGLNSRSANWRHPLKVWFGASLIKAGRVEEGERLVQEGIEDVGLLLQRGADSGEFLWLLARAFALLGDSQRALERAQQAVEAGFIRHPRLIELDPLLEPLRGTPEFERILARMRADQQEMARRVLEMEDAGEL